MRKVAPTHRHFKDCSFRVDAVDHSSFLGKIKYIIIERENHKDSNPNTKTATRGGGGAVDGVQD